MNTVLSVENLNDYWRFFPLTPTFVIAFLLFVNRDAISFNTLLHAD